VHTLVICVRCLWLTICLFNFVYFEPILEDGSSNGFLTTTLRLRWPTDHKINGSAKLLCKICRVYIYTDRTWLVLLTCNCLPPIKSSNGVCYAIWMGAELQSFIAIIFFFQSPLSLCPPLFCRTPKIAVLRMKYELSNVDKNIGKERR